MGMGDCGMEENADGESFHGLRRGIKGVGKGDEQAVGETIGATAGIILDEDTTVQLLTGSNLEGPSEEGTLRIGASNNPPRIKSQTSGQWSCKQ